MGHYPGLYGSDIPGQGPKLIVSLRRTTPFRIDAAGLSELTRPAQERTEPIIPSGEFEFRSPQDVAKGLGLGYDAERALELAVRQWIAEPDVVAFRKSVYRSLRSFAPRDYIMRSEIARRVQSLWKASRGATWSRRPGWEGQPEVVQKAEQMGLFGVSVSRPAAPKTVGPSVPRAPVGFSPIPNSTRGGYHKRVGAKYIYWYPDTGIVGAPHAEDHPAVHAAHAAAEAPAPAPKPEPSPQVVGGGGSATQGTRTSEQQAAEVARQNAAERGGRPKPTPEQIAAQRQRAAERRQQKEEARARATQEPAPAEPEGGGGGAGVLVPAGGRPAEGERADEAAQGGAGEQPAPAEVAEAAGQPGPLPDAVPDVRPPASLESTVQAKNIHYDLMPEVPPELKFPDSITHFPHPAPLRNKAGEVVGGITDAAPHQTDGAERIALSWTERDGAILQDDAGLGKTVTALMAMVHRGGARNLIVVPTSGKAGLKRQWTGARNAGLFGVTVKSVEEMSATEPGYYSVSYDELLVEAKDAEGKPVLDAKGKAVKKLRPELFDGTWNTIAFDESHNMVGHGERAEAAKKLMDRAEKCLYMSATPFTNVADMHYLTKMGLGFGNSEEEFARWADMAGARVKGKDVKNPTSHLPMAAIAATFHVDGASIKRLASLDGCKSQFGVLDKADLPEEQSGAFATAARLLKVAQDGVHPEILRALYIGWSKQYWETLKVDRAVALGKKALAEGKQVAFFTSFKASNHEHLRAIPRMIRKKADRLAMSDNPGAEAAAAAMNALADDCERIIADLPPGVSVVKRLADEFGGARQVAEIHGATSKKPEEEQDAYQASEKKVCVATMARGGTGISLHDTTGEFPRVQINLSIPWSGREFNQVAGRSHRLGSKSNTEMHWLLGEDDQEKHNAAIVARRLKSMGSLTAGDPELTLDAAALSKWEFANSSSRGDSDDIKDDIKALEAAHEAITKEQAGQDSAQEQEDAQSVRDYFREFGEARKSGRNVLQERYTARKEAKANAALLEAKRAAHQVISIQDSRAHFEYRPELGGFMIPSAFLRRDTMKAAESKAIGGKYNRNLRAVIIPPEGMVALSKKVGTGEVKVDMREVQAREREASKADDPVHAKGRDALLKHRSIRARVIDVAGGKKAYLLAGDTFNSKEQIKAGCAAAQARADFTRSPEDGWVIPVEAFPHVVDRVMGAGSDWRKSIAKALVIPDMPMDRLLQRARVKMMMRPSSNPGELIWCAEGVPDELHDRPSFAPPGWPLDVLGKAQMGLFGEHPSNLPPRPKMKQQSLFGEGGGEGSRGGHVTGHTASGAPIYGKHPLTGEEGPPAHMGPGWEPIPDSKQGGWKKKGEKIGEGPSGPVHEYAHWFPGGKEKQPGLFGKSVRLYVHALEKGASHKYIKRTATGNPKRPWRYWYKLPSGQVVASDDIKEGSKFRVAHGGVGGHFEVMGHDKDKGLVHVRHDESKQTAHIREHDLQRMVQGYHAKKTQEKLASTGEKPAAALPRAKIEHLGRGGYDEIHGFAQSAEELHRQAELMSKPDRDFAVIKQPGGFVLASKAKGAEVAEAKPEAKPEAKTEAEGAKPEAKTEAKPEEARKDVERHAQRAQAIESKITVVRRDPVTGEETVIGGGGKPMKPAAKPEASKPEAEQPAATKPAPEAPAPEERKTNLVMRAGKGEAGGKRLKSIPAEYVLMEAGDLVASHNPESFEERADYPKGVQERRYHEVEADRTKIDEIARNLEPALTVNTNPDAINGSPIITEDNVVLGGNGRTMGMQRAYSNYPEQASALKQYLARHARAFGYSSADVDKMKAPILVRKIKAGKDPQALGAMGRRMNESLTQGLDPRSQEVALGKHYVNRELLDSLTHHMDPEQSMSEFLHSSTSEGFVKALEKAGVIDEFNKGEFLDQETGLLNEDGRLRVERVLAARMIPDASLLSKMNQSLRSNLAKATPYLVQAEMSGWDLRKSLEAAVRADVEMRQTGMLKRGKETESRSAYLRQTGLGATGETHGEKVAKDPVATMLLEIIQDHNGSQKLPAGFKQLALEADRQHHDYGEQASMFARQKVEPHEALADVFKLKAAPAPPKKKTPEPTQAGMFGEPAVAEGQGALAMAMPAPTWRKAKVEDGGLGRYVMHAITWEAKNLVRQAVAHVGPHDGINGGEVLKKLRAFVRGQAGQDRDFARGLGAHPVSDTTLRGLVEAMAHAHVSHLAKSLAAHSLWEGWCKAVNQ